MGLPDVLAHSSRYALALVLVLAGVAKLANAADFRRAVANYRLLPPAVQRPVAVFLPRLEVVAAALLLGGVALRPVALGVLAMLLAFSLAVGINLARGRELDCGCFGVATPRRLSWWTIGRNAVLAGMAAVVAAGQPAGLALWPARPTGPAPEATDVVASAALAVAAVACAFVLHEALLARRRLRVMADAPGGTPA